MDREHLFVCVESTSVAASERIVISGARVPEMTIAMLPAAMVVAWWFVPETNAEDIEAMDRAVVA